MLWNPYGYRLKTRAGRASHGKRKQTVESVFGIIKAGMRFRQFLLRGLEAVREERSLVTMAWNIRRMAVSGRSSRPAPRPKHPGLPSETDYRSCGVSACATRDGFFYNGQRVVVVP